MSSPHKIDALLNAEELDELRAWCRQKRRTVDEVHDWLLTRGFTLSRGAAGNWINAFREEQMRERFSKSSSFAQAMIDAAKEGGAVAVADASMLQLHNLLLETAGQLDNEETRDTGDVLNLTSALKNLIAVKRGNDENRKREQAERSAAVADAEKAAKGGASADDVVRTIKRSLGITV